MIKLVQPRKKAQHRHKQTNIFPVFAFHCFVTYAQRGYFALFCLFFLMLFQKTLFAKPKITFCPSLLFFKIFFLL